MFRLNMSLVRSTVVVAVVVFSCSLGGAADQMFDTEIAQTRVDSTGVSWHPSIAYEAAVLTVSGPGDLILRRDFTGDEALEFSVYSEGQAVLEDGEYTWEIHFSPVLDPAIKKALADARENGDSIDLEALKKTGKLPTEPLVVSGYFRVKGGQIIVDRTEPAVRRGGRQVEPEGSAAVDDRDEGGFLKDQVILDDLIVDGSLCVGFDCVNGESFGFDTIRLKENNMRIRAVDTSSTASFPSNDWQITFNDTTNGGANKFSIDDIDGGRTPFTLEAGAPSHSLYVDDGGRIGFGTSTPVADLHVKSGNTPTLRLEQDGSSGFGAQTWDVAGNEANFFIRDATNGSTLPFRIFPGAPSNAITIEASTGDVGFGTTSPVAPLHINTTTGNAGEMIHFTNNGGSYLSFENTDDGTTWYFTHENNSPNRFLIGRIPGNGAAFALTGDGDLTIAGELVTGTLGSCTAAFPCDGVFSPDYEMVSIEEQGAYMWENAHLPAVGPTEAGEPLNVTQKLTAILHELEKAHIYIEQLNNRVIAGEKELTELRGRLVELE